MAAKKTSKLNTAPPPNPGETNQNRVLGNTKDVDLLKQWNKSSNAQQIEAYGRALSGDPQFRSSLQSAARGDSLSGRTTEGGTRSVLEGFRAFFRCGGLRSSGR